MQTIKQIKLSPAQEEARLRQGLLMASPNLYTLQFDGGAVAAFTTPMPITFAYDDFKKTPIDSLALYSFQDRWQGSEAVWVSGTVTNQKISMDQGWITINGLFLRTATFGVFYDNPSPEARLNRIMREAARPGAKHAQAALELQLQTAVEFMDSHPESVSRIIYAVRESVRRNRQEAEFVPAITAACDEIIAKSQNRQSVIAATIQLNQIESEPDGIKRTEWLRDLLGRDDLYIRAYAAEILWKRGEQDSATPVLLPLAGDSEWEKEYKKDSAAVVVLHNPHVPPEHLAVVVKTADRELIHGIRQILPEVVHREQSKILEAQLLDYRKSGEWLHEYLTLHALLKAKLQIPMDADRWQSIQDEINNRKDEHSELRKRGSIERGFDTVEKEMLRRWKESSPHASTINAKTLAGIAPWDFTYAEKARLEEDFFARAISQEIASMRVSRLLKNKWLQEYAVEGTE